MIAKITIAMFCCVLAAGCKGREAELEKQLGDVQNERTSLQQSIAERDAYFDEVLRAVNDIYADIERARAKESLLKKGSGVAEGPAHFTNADARQKLLQSIGDIGSTLKENRQKIANLQAKIKSFGGQIASLNEMITNLKNSLREREESIAQLEARVQGLETSVAEKTRLISQKDETIEMQRTTLNTAYVAIGTRDELKEKGIIADEGGFLWGLLGSTTVMTSDFDGRQFTPIDKTRDLKFHVAGKIDEILPRRKSEVFATAEDEQANSELTIVSPDKFWKQNYLVIVVDSYNQQ
ncbi:MAG: hypothetical protein AB1428_09520 [Bacteroidota bacterium]